ncbi:MAG: flagellar motor protein MotD [Methylococcaceae bacterium]|nr:flagellar motor protein MotD [Methylococcaceae bacterium]
MSRRRKQGHEEHVNLERWLVSYADFITLLFAFFVVMYSISSVNEGKYRVLSDTLSRAFDPKTSAGDKTMAKDIVQDGLRPGRDMAQLPIDEKLVPDNPAVIEQNGKPGEDEAQLARVAEELNQVLAPYIQDDLINIKRDKAWLEVEMKSGLLFASGSASLSTESVPMLDKLAAIFKEIPNAIQVEGHTDNRPINTREFPSNWELSAARAASVVHQLMRAGVDPVRMGALSYGEYHPLVDNGSEEGRYQNRRVTIVLQAQSMARYKLPSDSQAGSVPPPPITPVPAKPPVLGR